MSELKTLFDKAVANYNTARILRRYMGGDEEQLNIIAYHLQQALELSLKYTLEQSGVEYPKTHDIEQLLMIGRHHNVDLFATEYIIDHSEMFSQWEARSRYIMGYLIEAEKVDRAIEELDKYFKNIVESFQKEVTEQDG